MIAVKHDDLQRIGIDLAPDEFEQEIVRIIRDMPPARQTADKSPREMSDETRKVLEQGGLTFAPLEGNLQSPLSRTMTIFITLLATAHSVADAARMLGVNESRIRQRLGQRTLYGIKTPRGWRLPAFQFDLNQPDGLVPGIGRVLEVLPREIHPVGVYTWFTSPDPDLSWQGTPLSPIDWLRSGGQPEPVIAIATDL